MTRLRNVVLFGSFGSLELGDIEVQEQHGGFKLSCGAGGDASRVTGKSYVKVKSAPNADWYSTDQVVIGDVSYTVTRHSEVPYVEGDWLVFPVLTA